jgi:hypothetical protein
MPRKLKDDNVETDDDASNKQKTDTVTNMKTNQLISYKKSGQGKNITMQKHVYNYLTSNNGRLRTRKTNLSEYRSLVPDGFNASTNEFEDASENIIIDQVDDDLEEKLMAKASDQTTRNYFSEHDAQYGKYASDFKSLFGHHEKEIVNRISELRAERSKCRSTDRRREITQQITILEEDKKALRDSIRTETFLAHPDNLVALRRVFPTVNGIY